MLINTNDVPAAMPTISNVPEMAFDGVVVVVGGPPSDDAGWPVGGASVCRRNILSCLFVVNYIVSH